jgi:preprotein translocase subunit SecA
MRLFGSDRISKLMETLGLRDGESIEHRMISRAIENAQKRVEGHNFEIRKTLLDYDNVMNQQREVIYSLRRDAIHREDTEPAVLEFLDDTLSSIYEPYVAAKGKLKDEQAEWMMGNLQEVFNIRRQWKEERLPTQEEARACVLAILYGIRDTAQHIYNDILRYFLLEELDRCWKEHLLNMDHLRDGIGLRGYGQRDPKQEYKQEGFALFQDMLFRIHENLFKALTRLRLQVADASDNAAGKEDADDAHSVAESTQDPAEPSPRAGEAADEPRTKPSAVSFKHKEQAARLSYSDSRQAGAERKAPSRREGPKIGRNDDCPCGSGKKYKKCCGQ